MSDYIPLFYMDVNYSFILNPGAGFANISQLKGPLGDILTAGAPFTNMV